MLATALFHSPLESGVVVVFDMIVGAAWQVTGDFRPAIAIYRMEFEDLDILFVRPLHLLDTWVQMIVPP